MCYSSNFALRNSFNMKNRIKEQIGRAGMRHKDVAEQLGMSAVGLSQICGKEMPRPETLIKIAGVLGIPMWQLVLTDEEIEDIRKNGRPLTNEFVCPNCGATLKVMLGD